MSKESDEGVRLPKLAKWTSLNLPFSHVSGTLLHPGQFTRHNFQCPQSQHHTPAALPLPMRFLLRNNLPPLLFRLPKPPVLRLVRTAKTVSVVPVSKIKFDPPPTPLPPFISYPPVIQQAYDRIQQYPNAIVLTRVGSFYEAYFDNAPLVSSLLGIKLAQRKTVRGTVQMAGFPITQMPRYLRILVQEMGKDVVVCEEVSTESGIQRRVERIVSPGTYLEDDTDTSGETSGSSAIGRNWLLSVVKEGDDVGLAWSEIATGESFVRVCREDEVLAEVDRIEPREILVDDRLVDIKQVLEEAGNRAGIVAKFVDVEDMALSPKKWDLVREKAGIERLLPEEMAALNLLFGYVSQQFGDNKPDLQPPIRWKEKDAMVLDNNALRSLEIVKTAQDGGYIGSLLHTVRRTVTKGGTRLLRDWLTTPLMSLPEIEKRQEMVSIFVKNQYMLNELRSRLKETRDIRTIRQKLVLGKGDPDELISLARTIRTASSIKATLDDYLSMRKTTGGTILKHKFTDLEIPVKLANTIEKAIDEEGVNKKHILDAEAAAQAGEDAEQVVAAVEEAATASEEPTLKVRRKPKVEKDDREKDAWIMKKNASRALAQLHRELETYYVKKDQLTQKLRESYEAPTLTLKWSSSLSHHVHVRGKDAIRSLKQLGLQPKSLTSSRSTKTFHAPEWTHLGTLLESQRQQIRFAEQELFHKLRLKVIADSAALRRISDLLETLDVLLSFATIATELGWTRPTVLKPTVAKRITRLLAATHPALPLAPPPEEVTVSTLGKPHRLIVLTGPNMSGKSTLLKMIGLLQVLAQVGSYIPCKEKSTLTIVDRIFTRVNATDSLLLNTSRFKSEVLELKAILDHGTKDSLVLLDEPLTSTDPTSALALTYSVVIEVFNRMKVGRVVLATHFGKLVEMLDELKTNRAHVGFWKTGIWEDEDGDWGYIRSITEGVSKGSEALRVAGEVGLSTNVVARAETVKDGLQGKRAY
ncbi:hypothetical protein BJ508DRAFT_417133 [Ascobolus immersus RN42]|uniref:Uncharacterized protein n=1 Tax=Ascobolus immersus RN42 TaxID=1160509 RepID=A0A3N4HVR5_ASCIM|nr:hypothetical protein BJ508DRAFT_417133 [Ascobolus immersus RN42]